MGKGFILELLSRAVYKNGDQERHSLSTTHEIVCGVHISAIKGLEWSEGRTEVEVTLSISFTK